MPATRTAARNGNAAPAPVAPMRPRGGGRQTRPRGFSPYAAGGVSVVARRGVPDRGFLANASALSCFAEESALRLLAYLPDIDPLVGMAAENVLNFTCAPGDLQIVAVRPNAPGKSDDDTDDAGTTALESLWDALPDEVGGLGGLLSLSVVSLLFGGLTCAEGVPGPRGTGLSAVWPVDPLTLRFVRDAPDAPVSLEQRQTGSALPWKRLRADTVFFRAAPSWVDDPYGRAYFGAALAPSLADMATNQDVRNWVHLGAWGRIKWGMSTEQLYATATGPLALSGADATEWVAQQLAEARSIAESLQSDDVLFHDASGDVDMLQPGAPAGLDVLEYLRHQKVMAVKSWPTLLGINDGATSTFAAAESTAYYKGLERLRDLAVSPILRCADLHLRLLGLPMKAKAVWKPVRVTDELNDANALNVQIENQKELIGMKMRTPEAAAMELTGSGLVSPWDDEDFARLTTAGAEADSDGVQSAVGGTDRATQEATRTARRAQDE